MGATVTKSCEVTVKSKGGDNPGGTPGGDNPGGNVNTKTGLNKAKIKYPQTGDNSNIFVYAGLLIVSLVGLIIFIKRKRLSK